jgi:predicted SAM-dependent methyltransferase
MKTSTKLFHRLRSLVPGTEPLRLNLGCGARHHPAWLNLDVVPQSPDVHQHDLRDPLPFNDGSCGAVYCSHVLEHFARADAPPFLRECHRVLRSGGMLRVVVPDLETIARLYVRHLDAALAGDADAARRHEWMTLELLDQLVREESGGEVLKYWRQNPMPAEAFVIERTGQEVKQALAVLRQNAKAGETHPPPQTQSPARRDPAAVAKFRGGGEVHKWMYDRLSLGRLLVECDFADARVCRADESGIADFNSYCLDIDENGETRKPDSLFMEAIKP